MTEGRNLYSRNIRKGKRSFITYSKPKHRNKFRKLITVYFQSISRKPSSLYSLVNINLLRKEELYTKLKYSRSPAFDIVSGGAAAILAGLLGFLVTEKFGIELVDSGDFYYF